MPIRTREADIQIVEDIISRFGPDLRVATPLGLGKPVRVLNALYRRVESDPKLSLTLFTALSLSPPDAREDLAKRFWDPIVARLWPGERLAYLGRTPPNVRVHEFYFAPGGRLGAPQAQRDYQAINYTHVADRLVDERPRVVLQMIARRPDGRLSLSSNPDLTRDLVDKFRERGLPLAVIGVVHPDLPYLKGAAEVGPEFFDSIVDGVETDPLFALPRPPVDEVDEAIGRFASTLVVDDGTLQVGIGSLSDALVAALLERKFEKGLSGLSEMIMDGFMHLRRAGILKRVAEDGAYLEGGFFLGSGEFYEWLRNLRGADYEGVRMERISKVNQLSSRQELRKNARFFNTCMQATLLGGAASETLEDGRVVSGVGGQYNFVAMAHELPDARSILMLRSTREAGGRRTSNIVWSHGMCTIPRQLRDIYVTEYGIADVRGKSDEETIRAMIQIADGAFQPGLVAQAKKFGKLDPHWEIPEGARRNHPRPPSMRYPFGSDFTPEEERLAAALARLKKRPKPFYWIRRSFGVPAEKYAAELRRMGIAPGSLSGRALRGALSADA